MKPLFSLPAAPIALLLVASLGLTLRGQQASNNEEFARRQYDSGMAFMQSHKYSEGLKDLQAVADSFSSSSVADNALLQIAQYQLDVMHDVTATQAVIDKLLKGYPDTDSAPMAYVLAGRLALTKGRAPADVDAALASFERVSRLFPGSDAVPAAAFYAGETLRIVRRTDEALDRFRRVTMEYPRSIWAAQASLSAGYCLVQQDRATNGLQGIQWVRQQFPGSAAADEALNLNSILYRLYVRVPAQPAYAFSGRTIGNDRSNFNDVNGLLFNPDGQILLGHKGGVSVFDPKGQAVAGVVMENATAFFIDEKRRVVVARGGSLTPDRGELMMLTTPTKEGLPKQLEEIPSAVATSKGDRLVADGKAKAVIRVTADGKYVGVYSPTPASKLAINALDDVAMIDKSSKSIVIVDLDGKAIGKIPTKGTGYELDEPVDLAFDAMNHLYVLDRGVGSIFVFNSKNKFITSLSIPEKSPGAFTRAAALAVDPAGRLFIYDERAKRIQVYQ